MCVRASSGPDGAAVPSLVAPAACSSRSPAGATLARRGRKADITSIIEGAFARWACSSCSMSAAKEMVASSASGGTTRSSSSASLSFFSTRCRTCFHSRFDLSSSRRGSRPRATTREP